MELVMLVVIVKIEKKSSLLNFKLQIFSGVDGVTARRKKAQKMLKKVQYLQRRFRKKIRCNGSFSFY